MSKTNQKQKTTPTPRFPAFAKASANKPEFSSDWEEKKLDDLGKIIIGKTPPTNNKEYYGGSYLFVSPVDFKGQRYIEKTNSTCTEKGYKKVKSVDKGSVLFVCIGSTIGKIAQAGRECITNQQINSLVANENNSNDFIYYALLKNALKIKLLAGEQAVPILNKSQFSKVKINIPSLPEQRKIADFLSSVDDWLENLKQQKKNLEEYKKGMMQKIFSAKGGQVSEIRFKDENGEDFPEWEEKKFNIVFENKGGTALEKYLSKDGSHKFISIGNYSKKGEFIDNGNRIVLNNKTKEKLLDKNDLVMVLNDKTVCGDIIGSTILIDKNNTYIYNQRSERLICKTLIDHKFAWHYLNTPYFRKRIFRLSQGGTQIYVNFSEIKKMNINLPVTDEQQKIADFLTSLDNLINLKQQRISQVETWKQGLMQGLFV